MFSKTKARASKRQDLHNKFDATRDAVECGIREFTTEMSIDGELSLLYPYEWTETPAEGVRAIPCSLDAKTKEVSIINVEMRPGSVLRPHKHSRSEIIFCVDGDYQDSVNDIRLATGDVQRIAAGVEHGGCTENGCLLQILWRPPYTKRTAVSYACGPT